MYSYGGPLPDSYYDEEERWQEKKEQYINGAFAALKKMAKNISGSSAAAIKEHMLRTKAFKKTSWDEKMFTVALDEGVSCEYLIREGGRKDGQYKLADERDKPITSKDRMFETETARATKKITDEAPKYKKGILAAVGDLQEEMGPVDSSAIKTHMLANDLFPETEQWLNVSFQTALCEAVRKNDLIRPDQKSFCDAGSYRLPKMGEVNVSWENKAREKMMMASLRQRLAKAEEDRKAKAAKKSGDESDIIGEADDASDFKRKAKGKSGKAKKRRVMKKAS